MHLNCALIDVHMHIIVHVDGIELFTHMFQNTFKSYGYQFKKNLLG